MGNMEVLSIGHSEPEGAGMTQWQRVGHVFMAPSKTFADIKRGNRSWWLPFIISALTAYILIIAIYQNVGMDQLVKNQMRQSQRMQGQLAQATPDQQARVMSMMKSTYVGTLLASPILGLASIALVAAGILGTINFVFGGKATFGGAFATTYYAWLPMSIKAILGAIVLYAGMAPESFNMRNYAPTNLGAFLDPADWNAGLYSLASSIDLVTIWMLVLLSIGIATVAGVKRSSGYIAVFGWWAVFVLVGAGWGAMMS